jgi:hypothetical protein
MRASQEDRRVLKRVAEHHGLKAAQVIRMLLREAAHRIASQEKAPEARADAAWTRAMASFWQTGVAEKLHQIVAFELQVKATAKAIDEVLEVANACDEPSVCSALGVFRAAVMAYPNLSRRDRGEASASLVALFRAEGSASQEMFAWAARRAAK